jgi:hypothetical protein
MQTMRAAALLVVLGLGFAVGAQEFEVAFSGDGGFPCGIGSPLTFDAAFFLFPPPPTPDTPQREAAEFLDIRMLAGANGGRVFGLTSAGAIVVLSPDGTSTLFFERIPGAFPGAIAVAQSGRVFMTTALGLAVISPAGTLEALHPAGSTLPILGVAGDGCTVYYYVIDGMIRRINGCTGAVLPDFVTLADVHDIEPQPNGDVLVAAADSVLLYSAEGVLLRTVTSLGSDGGRRLEVWQAAMANGLVWIAAGDGCSSAQLLRVEAGTGREVGPRIPDLGLQRLTGLITGTASVAHIPTTGETTLILFAFALAAGGTLVLRWR